jgi:hypothetical protein
MLRGALLALAVAVIASGCGRDDNAGLIDDARSQELLASVDRIEAACADQDVAAAQAAVDDANAQISELPRRVDDELQANMRDWLEQVQGRLERDCEPEEEETPAPTPTVTETPAPTETPTPTETPEPTPTATETPAPTETPVPTEEPSDEDAGGVEAPELPGEGTE